MVNRRIDCYGGPVVEGIDVSQHQGFIRWNQIDPAVVRFAYIRLSPSGFDSETRRHFLDEAFDRNWEGAGNNRTIWRGPYQAIRHAESFNGEDHARLVINTLARVGYGPNDLPPALDIERLDGLDPRQLVSECVDWVRTIERELKRSPVIYTGAFWQHTILGGNPRNPLASTFENLPLWSPSYTECGRVADAWREWSIWQYTNAGRVTGISTRVDLNRFRGNEAAFEAFVRGSHIAEGTPLRSRLSVRLEYIRLARQLAEAERNQPMPPKAMPPVGALLVGAGILGAGYLMSRSRRKNK